ncbi:hypothetical protein QX201_012852 [Fusarium graminearum]
MSKSGAAHPTQNDMRYQGSSYQRRLLRLRKKKHARRTSQHASCYICTHLFSSKAGSTTIQDLIFLRRSTPFGRQEVFSNATLTANFSLVQT